jgi:hypothetical protein
MGLPAANNQISGDTRAEPVDYNNLPTIPQCAQPVGEVFKLHETSLSFVTTWMLGEFPLGTCSR